MICQWSQLDLITDQDLDTVVLTPCRANCSEYNNPQIFQFVYSYTVPVQKTDLEKKHQGVPLDNLRNLGNGEKQQVDRFHETCPAPVRQGLSLVSV